MPSQTHKPPVISTLHAIDSCFAEAGLVRSQRGQRAGLLPPTHFNSAEPEDFARDAPVARRDANGVEWLPVPGWDPDWLWAGFSTRRGGGSRVYCAEDCAQGELNLGFTAEDCAQGELNLGFTAEDDAKIVARNREWLAEAVTGDRKTLLVALRQFHSNLVVQTSRSDADRKLPCKADGQMTDEPGLLVAIQTADCIPVLVADRRRRAVAAFHAGWRGTVKRIVEAGIGRMRLAYGARPEDMVAAIGPGIGACCYAVGEEVFSAFESQFSYAAELFHEVADSDGMRKRYPMLFLTQRAPGHSSLGLSLQVDLIEANRRQLLDAGLKPGAIKVTGGCTQCQQELFFSHRGSHGHAGRMMAVIGIRAQAGQAKRGTKKGL